MLAILRLITLFFSAIAISLVGAIYSLLHFGNPENVHKIAQWFGLLHKIFGLKVIHRFNDKNSTAPTVYIGNHQNNFDMATMTYMVRPRTVGVGKKSLKWIPFFGLVFWASGNIFIDRNNHAKALNTMKTLADRLHQDQLSLWLFPEGTRSRGRGLLPFKMGAFHTAISAGVPIVPVVCSSTHNKVKWNRLNNGVVICEELDPIDVSAYNKENVRELAQYCHDLMEKRIAELDAEVAHLEKAEA